MASHLRRIYTYGSGVPANTFLPSTAINGASGARLPLLPRNALGREVKNSDQLNALIISGMRCRRVPARIPASAAAQLKPSRRTSTSPALQLLRSAASQEVLIWRARLAKLDWRRLQPCQPGQHPWSNTANFSGRNISIGP